MKAFIIQGLEPLHVSTVMPLGSISEAENCGYVEHRRRQLIALAHCNLNNDIALKFLHIIIRRLPKRIPAMCSGCDSYLTI
ncbi:unnamed protein product [Chondrus crispus]|uniref:Uncharacterized protein n=1 Tax=Chondrus crispus TaxID=2769 RepID=R7Q9H8_CHOCR|nr:unnamed protein product [Chondrus crispus]CDF34130.1 unnamed protein product [Chondrus crispus]|eukprot:XP_005713949.1 unnamed protein product [Chondrus crispus]